MDGVDYVGVVGFVCGVGGNSFFGCDGRVCGVACDEGIGDEEDIGSIDGDDDVECVVGVDCVGVV